MTRKNNTILLLRIVFVSGFILICNHAAGQFTIPKETNAAKNISGLGDTVRTLRLEREDYYSLAREKAERRERRRQRNYFKFETSFDISQAQFDNWTAGNDNTFMTKLTLELQHKYTRSKLGLESTINARYGMNYIESKMFKNDDYFRVLNAVTWKIHNNWAYSATSELISQFSIGRVSRTNSQKKSNFMSPGNWKPAIGLAYNKDPWAITISPIGGSVTFTLDDDLLPKDENGEPNRAQRAKWQVGSSLRVGFKKNMLKNVIELKTEFFGFTNYNKPPTMRWETTCNIKATKSLTTKLYSKLLYDQTSKVPNPTRVQYNYSIGVGMTYKFVNK